MKSCEQITDELLERRRAYEKKRAERCAKLKKGGLLCGGLCLTLLLFLSAAKLLPKKLPGGEESAVQPGPQLASAAPAAQENAEQRPEASLEVSAGESAEEPRMRLLLSAGLSTVPETASPRQLEVQKEWQSDEQETIPMLILSAEEYLQAEIIWQLREGNCQTMSLSGTREPETVYADVFFLENVLLCLSAAEEKEGRLILKNARKNGSVLELELCSGQTESLRSPEAERQSSEEERGILLIELPRSIAEGCTEVRLWIIAE